jgi:hypothetical protein
MAGALTFDQDLRQPDGGSVAPIRRPGRVCPKISPKPKHMQQKRHNRLAAVQDKHLSSGIMADIDDNALNGIVAFTAQCWRANARLRLEEHHVFAEGETGNSGSRADAVGLHAGHDL